jgi:ADP-heptose:LPS heptosyltransferase
VVHAGSGAERKNWAGFAAAAEHWRGRGGSVIEVQGPAEEGRGPLDEVHLVVREPLGRVAGLLRSSSFYLGNDSGISHLAAAVGAPGLTLFGSADARHWRPRSAEMRILEARGSCQTCGGFCLHRLPADAVIVALERVMDRLSAGTGGSRNSTGR